jgi:hypothetical protein
MGDLWIQSPALKALELQDIKRFPKKLAYKERFLFEVQNVC